MFSVGLKVPSLDAPVVPVRRGRRRPSDAKRRRAAAAATAAAAVPQQQQRQSTATSRATRGVSARGAAQSKRRPSPQSTRQPSRELLTRAQRRESRQTSSEPARTVHVSRNGSVFISSASGARAPPPRRRLAERQQTPGIGFRTRSKPIAAPPAAAVTVSGHTSGERSGLVLKDVDNDDDFEMDERGFPVLPDAVLRMRDAVGEPVYAQPRSSAGAAANASASLDPVAAARRNKLRQRRAELAASKRMHGIPERSRSPSRSPRRSSPARKNDDDSPERTTRLRSEEDDWDWWHRHGERPSTRRGTYFGLYPPGGARSPPTAVPPPRRSGASKRFRGAPLAPHRVPLPALKSANEGRGGGRGADADEVHALLAKLRTMRTSSEADQARALLIELRAMEALGEKFERSGSGESGGGVEGHVVLDSKSGFDSDIAVEDAVAVAAEASFAAAFAAHVAIAIAAAAAAVDIAVRVADAAADEADGAALVAAAITAEAARVWDAAEAALVQEQQMGAVDALLQRRDMALRAGAFRAWVAKQQRAARQAEVLAIQAVKREQRAKAQSLRKWNRAMRETKHRRLAALAPCVARWKVVVAASVERTATLRMAEDFHEIRCKLRAVRFITYYAANRLRRRRTAQANVMQRRLRRSVMGLRRWRDSARVSAHRGRQRIMADIYCNRRLALKMIQRWALGMRVESMSRNAVAHRLFAHSKAVVREWHTTAETLSSQRESLAKALFYRKLKLQMRTMGTWRDVVQERNGHALDGHVRSYWRDSTMRKAFSAWDAVVDGGDDRGSDLGGDLGGGGAAYDEAEERHAHGSGAAVHVNRHGSISISSRSKSAGGRRPQRQRSAGSPSPTRPARASDAASIPLPPPPRRESDASHPPPIPPPRPASMARGDPNLPLESPPTAQPYEEDEAFDAVADMFADSKLRQRAFASWNKASREWTVEREVEDAAVAWGEVRVKRKILSAWIGTGPGEEEEVEVSSSRTQNRTQTRRTQTPGRRFTSAAAERLSRPRASVAERERAATQPEQPQRRGQSSPLRGSSRVRA